MIDESRQQSHSRLGSSKRFRKSHALLSLATALGLVFGGLVLATPGQADQEAQSHEEGASESGEEATVPAENQDGDSIEEESESPPEDLNEKKPSDGRVCDGLDSGKIDTTGDPESVDIPNAQAPLPAGNVIVQYCVKAGSARGGTGGPVYVTVNPGETSLTLVYPSGKAISHYSFAYEPAPLGDLELVKSLKGGPEDYTGPFTIEYSCSMDDAIGKSGSKEIAAGSSAMVMDIPAGSKCVVSEPSLPAPPTGYAFGDPSFDPSATVNITSGEMTTVTTQNSLERSSGSLQILKELKNPDDAKVPDTFGIDYACMIGDEVTKSGSEDVTPGMTGVTVSDIPTGSTCTVTEQERPMIPGFTWANPSYDPRSGAVDIESDGQTYMVKVINQIFKDNPGRGQLELAKNLSGGPESYTGPFTLEYVCSKEGHDDVSGSRTVDAGSSAMISDLLPGSECVVSEPTLPTPPSGFSFGVPTFEPSATVQIKSKDKVTVTTKNTLTRDEGNLRITKSLTGTPADYDPDFDVSYTCTMEGEDDITGSATVAAGGSVDLPNEGTIPTGYECTVVEGALPTLPAGYSWNAPVYSNNQGTDPGNVVTIVKNTVLPPDQELPIDQMATVAIANSATTPSVPVTPASGAGAGALTVSKTLTGGPEGFAPDFSIAWACSGTTGSLSGVLSIAAGGSATVFNVPNGFTCSVSEDTLPDAPTGFSWGTPAVSGSPTSAIAGNSTVSVTVANSLIADEVAPVEPASPIQPTVPVEPASPAGPAQVEPAGVPLIVPAGGGGSIDTNDGLPVWGYLGTIASLGLAIWGAAYLLRGL
jgi:hypothetical protein